MMLAVGTLVPLIAATLGIAAGRAGGPLGLSVVGAGFGAQLAALGVAQQIGPLEAGLAILAFNVGVGIALFAGGPRPPLPR